MPRIEGQGASGCWDVWKDALKEWYVFQSKQVNEWQEQARREGYEEGFKEGLEMARAEFTAQVLLRVLTTKFGEVPETVRKSIQAIGNTDRLSDMLLRAAQSTSIEEWRQSAPDAFNGAPH